MIQALMHTVQWVLAILAAAVPASDQRPPAKSTPAAAARQTADTPQTLQQSLEGVLPNAEVTRARPRNPRVIFIIAKDCPLCDQELARLRRPGGEFDKMKANGWKIGTEEHNHLQIIDRDAIPELVTGLKVRDFPAVACISDGAIVRSFRSGCTTPLDRWTFGFLAKGIDQRPGGTIPEAVRVETTGSYPLRGNHWSIETDWNPTRERVIEHLRGPNHGSQIASNWKIESWSYEELRSLHDNLHEKEMGGVSFTGQSQSGYRGSDHFDATRKASGR
jgi:hypothetical protein